MTGGHLLNQIMQPLDRPIDREDRVDHRLEPAGAPDEQHGADDDPTGSATTIPGFASALPRLTGGRRWHRVAAEVS